MIDASKLDELRAEFDIIPLCRTLAADTITPVAAFAAVAGPSDSAFLLESVERGESLGRYSFIGVRPRRRLEFLRGDRAPAQLLRKELEPLRVSPAIEMVEGGERAADLPPFFGGAVGWFGYGAARWSEQLPDRHGADGDLDAELLFFDQVIAFDHLRQKLFVVANIFAADGATSEELLESAAGTLADLCSQLGEARADLTPFDREASVELEASMERHEFMAGVERAKEEIAAGEAFQIVLSQRWSTVFPEEGALTLYRALRAVNPSPYMFLLRTPARTLVGASPEMLVRVTDGSVEVRPIAGTRRRGATADEDAGLAADLLADEKENAEHLMLVDLGRNDVGRVAAIGTVTVPEFRRIERYSHVMHIVSAVRGRLRSGATPVDAFLSGFPAGTVSGAPKIRAMQLIDEIEPIRRGVYSGAVMYAGFSGNLDSCIAIRTFVLEGGRVSIQAGAGIVYDSVPEKEHEETVNKAAALARALRLALGALGPVGEPNRGVTAEVAR